MRRALPATAEGPGSTGSGQFDPDAATEDIEADLLLEAIFRRYGLDFRNYARKSLRRRIRLGVEAEGVDTVSALQNRVLHDGRALKRLVAHLAVHTTAMFRDPDFYCAFRSRVVPVLRSLPSIRIWHAGCATGQEVYSMAILLWEEGLLDRARLYATDMSDTALAQAKGGIFPLRKMQEYSQNYQRSAGTRSFSEYYTARYDHALFDPKLRRDVVWSVHNLATDASFNEFHVVLCRNVLIYFDEILQRRVHGLLHDSLTMGGYLALGRQEFLEQAGYQNRYAAVDPSAKVYRKIA